MEKISKTQIDRLGDRLRKSSRSDLDLKILDDYRRSFGEAYKEVVRTLREKFHLKLTGRPAKSTKSIIEKLHREKIRLSQMQDIAGCRVVVDDIQEQDHVIPLLRDVFPSASIIDRRIKSSHGYRAVHIIIKLLGKLIEVQIRTEWQHKWAEFSEKSSDKIDPALKYGGGDREILELLYRVSDRVKDSEDIEIKVTKLKESGRGNEELRVLKKQMLDIKKEITILINKHIERFR